MAEIYGGSERAVLGVAEKLLSNRLRVARSSLKGSKGERQKRNSCSLTHLRYSIATVSFSNDWKNSLRNSALWLLQWQLIVILHENIKKKRRIFLFPKYITFYRINNIISWSWCYYNSYIIAIGRNDLYLIRTNLYIDRKMPITRKEEVNIFVRRCWQATIL